MGKRLGNQPLNQIPHGFKRSSVDSLSLDILAQPPYRLAVSLPHDNTAHEEFHGPDALERHLALTRSLVHTELVTQLVLGHGVGVVDLVAEDHEGDLGEFLHGKQGVEFGFGFGEALMVFGVDKEDYTVDFGGVIAPDAAG